MKGGNAEMGYSELIGSYEKIRSYIREFYVYGFRSANEIGDKSQRTYNYERQRIESWLSEYMSFKRSASGRAQFLSVDSREVLNNPLYKAFKTKTFTDKEIVIHFILFDILKDSDWTSNQELCRKFEEYCGRGWADRRIYDKKMFGEKTIENKLKHYHKEGLLEFKKEKGMNYYRLSQNKVELKEWEDAIQFYSETNPLGVIGSYLLDKPQLQQITKVFGYKHHYLLYAIDSEIVYLLLEAIEKKSMIAVKTISKNNNTIEHEVYPLKIYLSVQGGREYLLCREVGGPKITFIRIDNIEEVRKLGPVDKLDEFEKDYLRVKPYLWGVVAGSARDIVHLEMTIKVEPGEEYIIQRLEKEKRNGSVHKLTESSYKYVVDTYDGMELMPWIRTFMGRILKIESNNPAIEKKFNCDMELLYSMYLGGDE